MQNKILIIDTSGIDPIRYSISKKQLQLQQVHDFFICAGVSLATSYECMTKEFTYEHNCQKNLLVESISESSKTFTNPNKVYMSYDGDFSTTLSGQDCLMIDIIDLKAVTSTTINCQTLWKSSVQWQNEMSQIDQSLVNITQSIKSEVCALLSNDYHTRIQCQNDGVKIYGTCSMLAGMTLTSTISYQKGSSIYSGWVKKDRKWVPKNKITKKSITFKEILDIEKNRMKNGESFWIN
ncbi:MAG: hypothetical protein ACD_11C00108G0035 [uncultured bacterium]|nr:MAG: hypothetical protein ACD_11C00108G0035 [uncultured bacterium]HBR71441.1 hypothetical protein [Candidatus Moranbacteria bacterium]